MVFSTYIFIFYFLPAVLLGYYALPWLLRPFRTAPGAPSKAQNAFLLAASYVFYGWWSPWFMLLMFFTTAANYVCGKLISRPGASPRARKLGLVAGVAVSLGTLGFFKYLMFFQANVNSILSWAGGAPFPILEIALPTGISFYTFQALTYLVDVFRGTARPARSLSDFACYVALYPQLVAGPIVRYNTVADQLVRRDHSWEKFSSGVALFALGLSKKVLLANPVGTMADAAFSASSIGALDAWCGVAAYAFQIYFDFSGYSDMAVGLGRMIGFEFMKNFDAPYRADSITEFWRRWHISLSTFLRDYLYVPLGGNRRGPRRTYINLATVMLLGGLWHGADWTFVAWGAYHSGLLALERWLGKRSAYHKLPRPARVAVTFVLVLFSWVLFRAEGLPEAARYIACMFGGGGDDPTASLLAAGMYTPGRLAALALCATLTASPLQAHEWCSRVTLPKAFALAPAFALALLAMFSQSFNPFLYFRF